jgi:hypothetical protein
MRVPTRVIVLLCCLSVMGAAQGPHRTARRPNWKAFVALTAAASAATVADIGLSRRCTALYQACREANPLLPRSAAGTWAIEFGIVTGMAALAYRLHPHHRWWAAPLWALVGAHILGAATAWHGLHLLRPRR